MSKTAFRAIVCVLVLFSLSTLAFGQSSPFDKIGLLNLDQLQQRVAAATPNKYDIRTAPSDSIRSLAIRMLFPLVRANTLTPLVTRTGAGASVTENPFPGLNNDVLVDGEHELLTQHWDAARDRFRKVIRHCPSYYPAYQRIGITFGYQKNVDSAVVYFQKAIHQNPFDYVPYLSLAEELYSAQRYDEARTAMIEALTLRPRCIFALERLHKMPELGVLEQDSIFAPRSYATIDEETVQIRNPPEKNLDAWKWYALAKGLQRGEPEIQASYCGSAAMGWCERSEYQCLHVLQLGYDASKSKTGIDPDIETLRQIEREGLLHAFMLYEIVTRMDEDQMMIADDADRDAVRKYIGKYILPKK